MAFRIATVRATLTLTCGCLAAFAGCGGNSDGVEAQKLNAQDARQALSDLAIDLPDGFDAQDFTRSSSFTGQPAYTGRFDAPQPAETAAREFQQLNPDVPMPQDVPCGAVPANTTWQSLGLNCSGSALFTEVRKPNGNEISILLQPSDGGTQLFVAVSGT
ncbi:hypothetical protein CH275_16680 [Rhodococcus sp. 06-235-1A]|uniref:hypothetical protein n=1 Tax=Rhodococcus sp. 06-235-1A TaxID=2022508 RepID=UPI000B9AE44B|nr:hypothetical protein [Rhodococcus sp. 06-235-1A]OZD03406.1 hypothetical protein CH275_16680 [Rhodococcus sp. 06-235-1A]